MIKTHSPSYSLNLFGGFRLTDNRGNLIQPGPRKVKALLAWLVVNSDIAHPRDKIAALFWPDKDEKEARHSLRQALASLRKMMPDPKTSPLQASRESIILNSARIKADVLDFDSILADNNVQKFCSIAQIYQGEFLARCNPRSDLFDEWLLKTRYYYQERASNRIMLSIKAMIERKCFEQVIPLAMQLIRIESLMESAYRALMIAHMSLGNTAMALSWYQRCEKILLSELGVKPNLKTSALHAQLRLRLSEKNVNLGPTPKQVIMPYKNRMASSDSKSRQRVLYQVESAIEGVFAKLGGQTILLRYHSKRPLTQISNQIVVYAKSLGFKVCVGEMTPIGKFNQNQAAQALCADISTCLTSSATTKLISNISLEQQMQACITAIKNTATISPMLIILNDIHVVSLQILKLLGQLISSVGDTSVLLIMTSGQSGLSTDKAWQGAMVNSPLTTIDLEKGGENLRKTKR